MSLILRRIQSYQRWDNPEDYTVHVGERCVGRIFYAEAGHPHEAPWMWTVEFHERLGRPEPHQGYTADLESAKQAFRESWGARRNGAC